MNHMTVPETATYMRRSVAHVKRLVASGALPSSYDGRRTVSVKDADDYLRKCRQVGTRIGAA